VIPPILCYHKIEPRRELGVTRLSPRRFARQMARFAAAGWRTIPLADVAACARGEREPGPREFAITFDDGYRGLRAHAFPVLADLGFTATCFVVTDYAGKLNRWDVAYGGRRFAHLAWRDMRAWQSRGIEFASHTATHPRLTWLGDDEVSRELTTSRRAIARSLDVDSWAISYPFGAMGRRERALAEEAGYTAGFALAGARARDAMAIERLPVYPWSPPMPGVGVLRAVERLGAAAANRCAVGTSVWQRMTRPEDGFASSSPPLGSTLSPGESEC
jgi:peptidoglycan/xylan/chitin deacetylase (PgdA/CDA1 family)